MSNDSHQSFGTLLVETSRLLGRRFDQQARLSGSTRAQWHAMFKLSRHEGLKQAELADMLEIEPITLTRMLDRMEEGGWVERRADPGDRRKRLLFLTDKAREAMVEMRALAQTIYDDALAGLTAVEAQELMRLLLRVRENLSAPAPAVPADEGKSDE
ncbi:MarR family winged helix-turn-helix transcriptional regulator [Niveispirillum irakense]|uniref:MarR family winged helix-turn-helix transcriptional regulator n=1 Tax=Niveispirillum irakense TaxID=34011 RepID=UPI00042477DF|nr:MarR family transcriptional regulator [Niveispirillum irakense]